MSYGLQISGTYGVQIDQDYGNYMRIAQGSCFGTYVDITLPAQVGGCVPQVFVRPHADETYVGGMWWFTSTPTQARIICNGSFDWIAYGNNGFQSIDSSEYGLQVLSPTGAVQFDSRHEVARIQSTVLVTQTVDGFGDATYPLTVGIPGGGWGIRPWFCVNTLVMVPGEEVLWGFFATNVGTSSLKFRYAEINALGTAIQTFTISTGFRRPFAGQNADVPVLRRYTD